MNKNDAKNLAKSLQKMGFANLQTLYLQTRKSFNIRLRDKFAVCKGGLQNLSLQTLTSLMITGFREFAGLFAEPIYKYIAGSDKPLLFIWILV